MDARGVGIEWGCRGSRSFPWRWESYPQIPMLFFSVDYARVSMRGSAENFAPKNRVSYKYEYWSSTACQAPLQQRALIIIIKSEN